MSIQFGLLAIPIIGLAGSSLDYANTARIHMALQEASDSSAVAAVAIGGGDGRALDERQQGSNRQSLRPFVDWTYGHSNDIF